MTAPADPDEPPEPLVAEAMRWVALVTDTGATASDALMAKAWRAQGPAHEAAFQEAVAFRRLVRAMPLPAPSAEVTAFRPRAAPSVLTRRAALVGGGGAVAAGLAGWAVLQPPLGLWPSLAELTADHHTAVGQRQAFALAKGVDVEVNARSAVSTLAGDQGLTLIDGEVFVSASRRAAPVLVRAGGQTLAVLNGAVNVRTSARETCATCVAGRAALQGPQSSLAFAAGQAVTLRAGAAPVVAKVDPTAAVAWRRGLLVFQDTPLAEALEAINRYRNGRVVIANAALAGRPISGVYHTAALTGVVTQLQGLLHVSVTRLPGGVVILS